MVADVAERSETTRIFLLFHAADVVADCLGPGVSALLMGSRSVWSVRVLAQLALLACIDLTGIIPETLHLRINSTTNSRREPSPSTG
ncbi:hypothetical protein BJX76DRAFT_327984 [Aspergillus varians]